MNVELLNGLTLKMEIGYGRIKYYVSQNGNNILTRYIICLQCEYENVTKGGIETHLARKRNGLQLHYNLKRPYCPKMYRYLGSINRRLYKKCAVTI